eukprot:6178067-Pleurochrysis_carterae.AAC.1
MATPKAATFRKIESNAQVEICRGEQVARDTSIGRVAWVVVSGASDWPSTAVVASNGERWAQVARRSELIVVAASARVRCA